MNIAIIGGQNSGKTTFLVLLYAAQIRYSELSEGGFRFYIDPDSLKLISEEYNTMLAGGWPSDKLLKRAETISFLIGGDSEKHSGAGSSILNLFRKQHSKPKLALNFQIYSLTAPELANMVGSATATFMNISDRVESLLSSRLLVIIIDCSTLQILGKNQRNKEKNVELNNDIALTTLLGNIARYQRKSTYPIIIFSKFDQLGVKILKTLNLPRQPPGVGSEEPRQKYSEKILQRYYPNTLNMIRTNKHLSNLTGSFFFSSVTTILDKAGKPSPALMKGRELKYILNCSYEEYIGFIKYLEKISEISQ